MSPISDSWDVLRKHRAFHMIKALGAQVSGCYLPRDVIIQNMKEIMNIVIGGQCAIDTEVTNPLHCS